MSLIYLGWKSYLWDKYKKGCFPKQITFQIRDKSKVNLRDLKYIRDAYNQNLIILIKSNSTPHTLC